MEGKVSRAVGGLRVKRDGLPGGTPVTIANGLVLEGWDATPRPGAIRIEGERIAAIAYGDAAAALVARGGEVCDAQGAVAMPALVNAHHHSYGNLLRGTENGLPLELWALFTVAWGRALDAGLLRLAILVGAAEMLRAGVASVIDHSPMIRLYETSIAAHRESGMRVGYAPMLHDRHDHDLLGFELPPALRAAVEGPAFPPHGFYEDTISEIAAALRGDPRLALLLAPNAPQRCSPALLALWGRLRDRHALGVHTHLLETRAQAILCRRLWPGGLVAELVRHGLLQPGMAVAHGVWATAAERDLLARHGVVVVHNPASNLMLGSGVMPFAGQRAAGVTLALGSDGANSGGTADPFELMRLAQMLPRIAQTVGADGGPFVPSSPEVLRLATEGGAAALGLQAEAGRLAPGRLADIALVALDGAGSIAIAPAVDTLVRHGGAGCVRATMVGGAWAWRDGRITAFDETAVLAAFRDRAAELGESAAVERRIAGEAAAAFVPQLRALYAANESVASPG